MFISNLEDFETRLSAASERLVDSQLQVRATKLQKSPVRSDLPSKKKTPTLKYACYSIVPELPLSGRLCHHFYQGKVDEKMSPVRFAGMQRCLCTPAYK